jgi:ribosome-associated translation inhibitor RaiA
MILPVQTTFRNMDPSAAVAARVQEEADKLDKYFDRITSCRVIVEAPHRHHRRGEPFHIRIELGLPGKELVVTHEPTLEHEEQGEWHKHLEVKGPHKDMYVAIRDAFKVMRRQLQDYVRCLRHDVKTHYPAPHAKVSKLFPKEGYGFIAAPTFLICGDVISTTALTFSRPNSNPGRLLRDLVLGLPSLT